MLQRFTEQASAIQCVLRELKNEAGARFVSNTDRDEIEGLQNLLKPFYEITEIMYGQKYVLASSVRQLIFIGSGMKFL